MNLLDRYIFKQFCLNFLLVLCSLLSIYLLVDFFERIDNFSEAGKSIGLASTYFFLKIPFIYNQMSPVCILLAGVITLGLLHKNRELMSLNAGGISLMRIVSPIVATSMLLTLLPVAVAQWVLPDTIARTNQIWHQEVNEQYAKGIVRNGRIFYRGEEGIYSLVRPRPKRDRFRNFIYTAWDDSHQNVKIFLTAKSASWSEKGWLFRHGQLKKTRPDGGYDIKIFSRLRMDLPDSPEEFFVPAYRATELSLSELYQQSLASYRQGDRLGLVDINRRLSFIFLGVPLLLLSLPVMHAMQRKWNRDLSMTIPISCAIAFCAWAIWNAAQSMSQAAYVDPIPASWTIHAILTVSGGFMLWRINNK